MVTTYELCLLPKVGFPGEGPKERRETHELHDGHLSDVFPRRVLDKHFYPHPGSAIVSQTAKLAPKCRNGSKIGPALTIRRRGSCTSPARPFPTAARKRNVKVLPCELLVPQRRSLIVSSTATRLGWKLRWKHCAIAIGSGRRPWMISSWRRKSAGGSCGAHRIWSRLREETRGKFAGFGAAAAVESGGRTQAKGREV
jgi:hypothetical protein